MEGPERRTNIGDIIVTVVKLAEDGSGRPYTSEVYGFETDSPEPLSRRDLMKCRAVWFLGLREYDQLGLTASDMRVGILIIYRPKERELLTMLIQRVRVPLR